MSTVPGRWDSQEDSSVYVSRRRGSSCRNQAVAILSSAGRDSGDGEVAWENERDGTSNTYYLTYRPL